MTESESLLKTDVNELPIFNASMRAIPVIKKIFERVLKVEGDHDGRKKRQNVKEAAFIHFYTHFQLKHGMLNPFWKYTPEIKYDKLKQHFAMPEGWGIDADLQAAIDFYRNEIVQTFEMDAIDAAEHATRQTIKYFKDVDYERRDIKGNLLYKPLEVMRAIKELGSTLDELVKTRERIQNGLKTTAQKVRGGGEVGSREVPKR